MIIALALLMKHFSKSSKKTLIKDIVRMLYDSLILYIYVYNKIPKRYNSEVWPHPSWKKMIHSSLRFKYIVVCEGR